jgi:hypothetical protein
MFPPAPEVSTIASRATAAKLELGPTTVTVAPPSSTARELDIDMPGGSVAFLLSDAAARVAASADSAGAAATLSELAAVLRAYAQAYGALDIAATRQLWPGVDERALASAFESLASRSVAFEACDINVQGTTANASCRGTASSGRVSDPRAEPRTWRFELRRDGQTWRIENAESRRDSEGAGH